MRAMRSMVSARVIELGVSAARVELERPRDARERVGAGDAGERDVALAWRRSRRALRYAIG